MLGPTSRMAVVGLVEQVLNRALMLDPPGRQRLLACLDRPVTVVMEPMGVRVSARRERQALVLHGEPVDDPAVTISGTPLGFLALAQGETQVFQQGRVTIEGDAARAQQLQQTLQELDLDWEGSLAASIGDVPAHFIGRRVRQTLKWLRQAHAKLGRQVESYLQEETRMIPGRNETEAFWDDVDTTRLDADRLEARIARLEGRNQADDASETS
ncbi:SCP2 sterol-binding domain-containing protein [Marinobacteraceae bacterium S3BR75-40.1]